MNVPGRSETAAQATVETALPQNLSGFEEGSAAFKFESQTRAATIYLDMTDLIEYVKVNTSVSGIQRVVGNLIKGLGAYRTATAKPTVIPVIPEYDNCRIFAVDQARVVAMIDALEDARSSRAPLNKAIEAVYASRKLVEPRAGDAFVIAGAFWIYVHFDMVRQLRDGGVRFVVFVHDLIQISHPEYVHEAATLSFRRSLVDVLTLADAVLTNSEFVADDVRDFMRGHMKLDLPVTAIPLATELKSPSGREMAISPKVREILRESYVLSVATIEVRKNHMYMVRIWEALIRNDAINIPLLVFAGKMGWDIEPFRKYLSESDCLGGRLHVINDVTDYELSQLYDRAMFTMFPSFIEGFGLPVGESLAHGKPCIASKRASMPEVGGKFARYVDPDNVKEGIAEVERLLRNPDELERWSRQVAQEYRPRTWSEFVTDFLDTVREVEKRSRPINTVVNPAEVVGMGRDEIKRRENARKRLVYLAPTRVRGWHPVEAWGCWASLRRAELRIPTALSPNAATALYLMLALPEGTKADGVSVTVEAGGVSTKLARLQAAPKWYVVDAMTGVAGLVEITLVSAGTFSRPDTRELFVGLRALAYCAHDDIEGRMTLLETISGLRD